MDQSLPSVWSLGFSIGWVVIVIVLSIVFRQTRGKPIFPKIPVDAIYVERWASGRWANKCLLVAVTNEALWVVPKFPFNLMFLPEIFGLEHTIPIRSIRSVSQLRAFGVGNVAVYHGEADLRLKVRNPQAFVNAFPPSIVRAPV